MIKDRRIIKKKQARLRKELTEALEKKISETARLQQIKFIRKNGGYKK